MCRLGDIVSWVTDYWGDENIWYLHERYMRIMRRHYLALRVVTLISIVLMFYRNASLHGTWCYSLEGVLVRCVSCTSLQCPITVINTSLYLRKKFRQHLAGTISINQRNTFASYRHFYTEAFRKTTEIPLKRSVHIRIHLRKFSVHEQSNLRKFSVCKMPGKNVPPIERNSYSSGKTLPELSA